MLMNITVVIHRLTYVQINGAQSKPAMETILKDSRACFGGEIRRKRLRACHYDGGMIYTCEILLLQIYSDETVRSL